LLSCAAWLDDDVIGTAQSMLKQRHYWSSSVHAQAATPTSWRSPTTNSLREVCNGATNWEFVQLLNVHGSHWVAVSTAGCPPSTINVYNSLHGRLPEHAQKLVADITQSCERATEVQCVDVQCQSGACDCGLLQHVYVLVKIQ